MSSKRSSKDAEFPELEGVMFISPAERAKAEARIRAQREEEAKARAEAARLEEVSVRENKGCIFDRCCVPFRLLCRCDEPLWGKQCK